MPVCGYEPPLPRLHTRTGVRTPSQRVNASRHGPRRLVLSCDSSTLCYRVAHRLLFFFVIRLVRASARSRFRQFQRFGRRTGKTFYIITLQSLRLNSCELRSPHVRGWYFDGGGVRIRFVTIVLY